MSRAPGYDAVIPGEGGPCGIDGCRLGKGHIAPRVNGEIIHFPAPTAEEAVVAYEEARRDGLI